MTDFLLQHYLCHTAERCPDHPALRYEGHELTYRELLEESVVLSDTLIGMGMETGEIAAIYLNKSQHAVAAMFGVLFTAGTYIPLDSYYSPVNRTLSILEQSQARFLITSGANLMKLIQGADSHQVEVLKSLHVLVVDGDYSSSTEYFQQYVHFIPNLTPQYLYQIRKQAISDDLAYILYTSGSTGIPKGVMISHLNARTFIDWCCNYFQPDAKDRFASIAPFHFDLSVFDIFVPVAVGAELVILPAVKIQNPSLFAAAIKREEINWIYSVPSLWNAVIKYAGLVPGELASLKNVLFAGEVFQPKYLRLTMELLPQASFYNLYGLIETNVCTYYPVKDKESVKDTPVPIGYPCENTEVVVIHPEGRIAGIGEEGELCVRGSIVMKGYYRNPLLTEQCFRTSPVPGHRGERLYHTGDMVRINEERAFVLVGRKDSLVKRSGFRIELPEIERVLHDMDGIAQAAVVDVQDEDGNVIICAALTLRPGEQISVIGLKQSVGVVLPHYMIPDLVHVFEQFPTGSSEKIDRRQLKEIFRNML
ncbi:amino acid adenylation domain-containing protein [Paenibacillus sp. BR2-3]|uniref:amino acid adenylation domain-containing protein n=1 Tax=Paenibacillus sp. BR2-3 TaxID=3048494 RepID=UPI0039778D14